MAWWVGSEARGWVDLGVREWGVKASPEIPELRCAWIRRSGDHVVPAADVVRWWA